MEDDDEFGDLYTDVLAPFTTSSALHTAPIQTTAAASISGPIDSDDEEILFGAPNSNHRSFGPNQPDSNRDLNKGAIKNENLSMKLDESKAPARVLESGGEVKVPDNQKSGFEDPNFMDESEINFIVDEGDDVLRGRSNNFDVQEVNIGIGDSMIPGLSIPGVSDSASKGKDADFGEGDDWDSDSEDDLQIVLNDNNHGPMAMDRDEDEDGDPLVIVADSDPNHQQIEEQVWGEDAAAQGGDGDRKELGDGSMRVNGVGQPLKTAYGYHHQFHSHSQFKYVRPGAAPIPGATPAASGVPPGQVRPPVSMGPTLGRGRGDWRAPGMYNAPPITKSFQPGYGMPAWGNNASGHGVGRGLDFTLPSHKTIFEVDINGFEEKPWRLPGIDISDFFNFGLAEESWKDYGKQLEQHRLEGTMQSKIRVYESGRTEQEYDPDMPPELAAAAGGIHDVSSESANLGKADAGQSDLGKGSMVARQQLPTGRAIPVETSNGERLPSIDTRLPRIRDLDAIIEIVLQDSGDSDSIAEVPDNDDTLREEDLKGGDGAQEDTEVLDDSVSKAYSDQKREELVGGRKTPLNSPSVSEAPPPTQKYRSDSKEQTLPVYHRGRSSRGIPRDDRRTKGRVRQRSLSITRSGSTQDKKCPNDNHKDESAEQDFEHEEAMATELVQPDGSSSEEIDLNMAAMADDNTLKDDENVVIMQHSLKKSKLGSQVVEQQQPSCLDDIDDEGEGEDSKAAKSSSENSKARSGGSHSRDYHQNSQDGGVEDEVVQDGRSTQIGKRPLNEDNKHSARSKGREERKEIDRDRMVVKGKIEDSSYHHRKNWDSSNLATIHHSHKTEISGRRKESDNNSDGGAWEWNDEDHLHGRRKRDRGGDGLGGSSYRTNNKVREHERSSDIDEHHHQLRKQQLDNGGGSWRGGHHDMGRASRHRDRDDNNLKTRIVENFDDPHGKRRKEEGQQLKRRDHHGEKEELLLQAVHREHTTGRRKRERDEIIELQRKREDDMATRLRNDEAWFQRDRVVDRQRERNEWQQRLKQSHEELTLSKRERQDVRGRAAEEKSWGSHSRGGKDDLKGSSDRVEYHLKDPLERRQSERYGDQLKRRDRTENESLSHRIRGSEDVVYSRGNQLNKDERRSRQERPSTRNDRAAVNAASDISNRPPEKKYKENNTRKKSKESEVDQRIQEVHSSQISDRVRVRGTIEQGSGEHAIPADRHSSRKHKEVVDAASSDDEHQDSRKGRSKLERWTSHKENDFSIGSTTKSSSSLDAKEIGHKKGGASLNKVPDESSKKVEIIQGPYPMSDEKDVEVKPREDRHLDTVLKLKKRSERFNLPMPIEKEAVAVKRVENEPVPPVQTETRTDLEIKQGRPPRKRRWTSN